MKERSILLIPGSLRKDSINKAVARAIAGLSIGGVKFEIAYLTDVPLYNGDLEEVFPVEASELKEKVRAADAVILITPEYNRSVPGVLKNALDWTSRPYGDNVWAGKAVAVTGASGGAVGTALAQFALMQSLLYLDARVVGQPEVYIGGIKDKMSEEGNIVDPKTIEMLLKLVQKLLTFIPEGK